jgi:hypothetical protein
MLNITLVVALIFLLLILPGAIFRRAYHTSSLSNYHLRSSNFSEIVVTLGAGTVIQLFFLHLVNLCIDRYINFEKIGELLIQPRKELFIHIGVHLSQILLYIVLVYLLSYLIGRLLLLLVLKAELDLQFQSLRFDNDWHYIFSRNLKQKKPDVVVIYALVQIEKGYYLYRGFLVNYSLDSKGELDFIQLVGTGKKLVSHDSNISTVFIPIDDDKLILPYREILNLSVRYFTIDIEVVSVSSEHELYRVNSTP